ARARNRDAGAGLYGARVGGGLEIDRGRHAHRWRDFFATLANRLGTRNADLIDTTISFASNAYRRSHRRGGEIETERSDLRRRSQGRFGRRQRLVHRLADRFG